MYLFPVTKKILLGMAALWMGAAFVFPGMGWAIFGSQGNDYSANAGSTFYCANPAGTAVTTQAGLSATNPALTLVNPSGSNKRVVLLETQIVPTALPLTLVSYSLAYSTGATNVVQPNVATSTQTDQITYSTMTTVIPSLIINTVPSTTTVYGLSQAQCYRGSILPNTPVAFRYLGTISTAAISGVHDSTDGRVVMPPGTVVSIQATAASSILANFVWREDPN